MSCNRTSRMNISTGSALDGALYPTIVDHWSLFSWIAANMATAAAGKRSNWNFCELWAVAMVPFVVSDPVWVADKWAFRCHCQTRSIQRSRPFPDCFDKGFDRLRNDRSPATWKLRFAACPRPNQAAQLFCQQTLSLMFARSLRAPVDAGQYRSPSMTAPLSRNGLQSCRSLQSFSIRRCQSVSFYPNIFERCRLK